jgi:chromosome segregation ATPase
MGRARRRDGEIKRQHAAKALQDMAAAGEPISFPAVARRAGVSVTLLYADQSLAAGIAGARDRQRQAGRDRAWRLPARALVTEQSLRADLANAKEQARRLSEEVRLLRERLARDLGAEADLARGQATSPLLDQLEERAAELEYDNASLRRRVADLEVETRELAETLQAARAMNRELMSELNRSTSDASSSETQSRLQKRPTAGQQQPRLAPR